MRGICWLAAKPVSFSRRALLHRVSKQVSAIHCWVLEFCAIVHLYSCSAFVKAVFLQHGKYDSVMTEFHVLDFDINGEWSHVAYGLTCFFMARQLLVSQGLHCSGFEITLRHTTLGRTTLEEWSARHIKLYLATNNAHNRQISILLAGLEPSIVTSERPQNDALNRAATGIGISFVGSFLKKW